MEFAGSGAHRLEATSTARNDLPFADGATLGAFRVQSLAQVEPHAHWYRATRLEDRLPVLLYLPRHGRRLALERQRALLAPIASPTIDRALDIVDLAGRPAAVVAQD